MNVYFGDLLSEKVEVGDLEGVDVETLVGDVEAWCGKVEDVGECSGDGDVVEGWGDVVEAVSRLMRSLGSMISERRVRRRWGAGRVIIMVGELGREGVVVVGVVEEGDVDDALRDVGVVVVGKSAELVE